MPIKRIASILHGRRGMDCPSVAVAEIATELGISSKQASVELGRLVKSHLAIKPQRGHYRADLRNIHDLELYLNTTQHRTQQTQHKDGTRDGLDTLPIRYHQLRAKCSVTNGGEIADGYRIEGLNVLGRGQLDDWRKWPASGVPFFEKVFTLSYGVQATMRYCHGPKKRTLEADITGVYLIGDSPDDFKKKILSCLQELMDSLHLYYGFKVGSFELITPQHFAVPIPVWKGYKLRGGKIPIGDYWWVDSSKGYPELETSIKERAEELVATPKRMDQVEEKMAAMAGVPESVKEMEGLLAALDEKTEALLKTTDTTAKGMNVLLKLVLESVGIDKEAREKELLDLEDKVKESEERKDMDYIY